MRSSRWSSFIHIMLTLMVIANVSMPAALFAATPPRLAPAAAAANDTVSPAQPGIDAAVSAHARELRAPANQTLQFRSPAGQLLSFTPERAYFLAANQFISTEFVGASGVAPVGVGAIGTPGGKPEPVGVQPYLGNVTYAGLWPGIKLSYDPAEGGMVKTTYTLDPGATVASIRLRYNHAVATQPDGGLRIAMPDGGYLSESAPLAWQDLPGGRAPVQVAFSVAADGSVGYTVGSYDLSQPLVIDPVYAWHAFFRGTTYVADTAIDSAGNVYYLGSSSATWGTPLAGTIGSVLVKLNSAGVLQWNRFFDQENVAGIQLVIDSADNIYMTASPFAILKLDANGTILWKKSFNANAGARIVANGIAVDAASNVYIGGLSENGMAGMPQAPLNPFLGPVGRTDILVMSLTSDGSYRWHTFYGSADSNSGGYSGDDGLGIAVDAADNALYVVGNSMASWNGPSGQQPLHSFTGTGTDAVMLKLTTSGAYQWHDFNGDGQAIDRTYTKAAVANGKIYTVGYKLAVYTSSGARSDGDFTAQSRRVSDVAADDSGNIYYAGGVGDIYVAKTNGNGAVVWSTFYGQGDGFEEQGQSIAARGTAAYIGGFVLQHGGHFDGPNGQKPLYPQSGYGREGFIIKLYDGPGIDLTMTGNGKVKVEPPVTTCDQSCVVETPTGAVTLTATPLSDTVFVGWSGACSGASPTCTLNITDLQSVGAQFKSQAPTNLVAAPSPSAIGQTVAITYSLASGLTPAPSGALTLSTSTGETCNGSAPSLSCNVTPTATGTFTITGSYAGDTTYAADQRVITQTVQRGAANLTLTSAPATPVVGQPVSIGYSLSVAPAVSGPATGTLLFTTSDGQTTSGNLAGGSWAVTPALAGTLTITATYSGSSRVAPAASTTSVVVNKADTTLTLSGPSGVVNPYEPLTIGYTLAVSAPGAGTPTGPTTITSSAGGGCVVSRISGTCVITPTELGAVVFTANYGGDANFNASGGNRTVLVGRVGATVTTSTISTATPNLSLVGQPVTVSYGVTAASGTPSGKVIVFDGEGNSCTGTVAAGSCDLTLTNVGTKTIQAVFLGDASYGPSQASHNHTVARADVQVDAIGALPAPSIIGRDPVRVYFAVRGKSPASGTPPGSVRIDDSDGNSCTATVAAGFCTLPPSPARDNLVGTKTITVTYLSDSRYNSGSATTSHSVADMPPSGLTLAAADPAVLLPGVSFTAALATGTNVRYTWDFGDNTDPISGTSALANHAFRALGTYTVTVTAENVSGALNTSKMITVVDAPITGLSIRAQSLANAVGSSVIFTATAATGTNISYNWDFGDGAPHATGDVVNHIFTRTGPYSLTLTATNSRGTASARTYQRITSQVVGLTAEGPGTAFVGDQVGFSAAIQFGQGVEFVWEFGDGQTLTTIKPLIRHTYSAPGTYQARVTATNGGSSLTQVLPISVGPRAIGGLSVSSAQTPVDNPTTLSASIVTGTNMLYTWDFGDGSIPLETTNRSVTHTYVPPLGTKTTTTYLVKVTAANDLGSVEASAPVLVVPERQRRQVGQLTIIADRFLNEGGDIRAIGGVTFVPGDARASDAMAIVLKGKDDFAIYNLKENIIGLSGEVWATWGDNVYAGPGIDGKGVFDTRNGGSKRLGIGTLQGMLSERAMTPGADFQIDANLQLANYPIAKPVLQEITLPGSEGGYGRTFNWTVSGTGAAVLHAPDLPAMSVPLKSWTMTPGHDGDRFVGFRARVFYTLQPSASSKLDFTFAQARVVATGADMSFNSDNNFLRIDRVRMTLPASLGGKNVFPSGNEIRLWPDRMQLTWKDEMDRPPTFTGDTMTLTGVIFETTHLPGKGYKLDVMAFFIDVSYGGQQKRLSCDEPRSYFLQKKNGSSTSTVSFTFCSAGYVDTEGVYHLSRGLLDLNMGGYKLTLYNPEFSFNDGVSAERGTIQNPENLGGGSLPLTKIKVGNNKVTVDGSEDIPLPDVYLEKSNVKIRDITARFRTSGGRPASFSMTNGTGTAELLSVPSQPPFPISDLQSLSNGETPKLRLPAQSFQLAFFGLDVPGFELHADGSFYSKDAAIGMLPSFKTKLGAATVTVYNIELLKDGSIRIGGGEFALPDINLGSFKLTDMGGKVERTDTGYDVTGSGGFSLTNIEGKKRDIPCSGLGVELTLSVDKITIKPSFKRAALSVDCKIPIGTTGFAIAQVRGSVELGEDKFEIGLGLTIESEREIKQTPVLAADIDATLRVKPSFLFTLEGSLKVFVFKVASAKAQLWSGGFAAELNIKMAIVRGKFSIATWFDDDGFSFTASARVSVVIPEGMIARFIPWNDVELAAVGIDLGRFTNDKWGARGYVEVLGTKYGAYVNTQGDVDIGNVDNYKLRTPTIPEASAAQQAAGHVLMQRAKALRPIALLSGTTLIQETTIGVNDSATFALTSSGGGPTLSLRDPVGTLITPSALPAGVTYDARMRYLVPNLAFAASGQTRLRFVAAAPTVPAVRVLVNGIAIVSSGAFGTASDYVTLAAGPAAVQVLDASSGAVIASANVTLASGAAQTLALSSPSGAPTVQVLNDDAALLPASKALVRLVNLASNRDLGLHNADQLRLVKAIGFGAASPYQRIASGLNELTVRDSAALTETTGISELLLPQHAYSLFALPGGQALLAQDTPRGPQFRLVNALQGQSAVDLYATSNGTERLLAGNVAFGTATAYAAVPGATTARVTPVGAAGTTLFTQALALDDAGSYTLAASGTATPTLLSDDLAVPQLGETRLRIVNLGTSEPLLARRSDGLPLASGLGQGDASAYLPMDGGNYTVELRGTGGALRLSEAANLIDGQRSTLFALPGGSGLSGLLVTDLATQKETGSFFTVKNPQPGVWQTILDGVTQVPYTIQVFGTVPAPRVTNFSVSASGTQAVQANWTLATLQPGTRVSLHANNGPISHTEVVTDGNGIASTVTVNDYVGPSLGGERTLTETNVLANGTPQNVGVTASLSGLPSGTYNLWLSVDDGRSPPVKLYASQPITIAARAFAATWNPTITTKAGLRRIDLAWTAHPNPDATEYAVEVSGPSFGETTVYTVGQQLSLSLANLTPSETYTFTVLARNEALGQTARSQVVTAVPLNAPLTLSAPAGTSYTTEVGQTFTVKLSLSTPLARYPEGAGISVDVPDGLVVELPSGLFNPTVAGTQVPVTIRAVRDIPGSTYTLPFHVQGVGATSQITLSVSVTGKTLTVARAGAGSGVVTSDAAVVDCGTSCTATLPTNTQVTLSATPADGSVFSGWTGGCAGAEPTCVATLDTAKTVTARFELDTQQLRVARGGKGSGAVTSAPAQIDCGASCTSLLAYGTEVTLTATPAAGAVFTGWSGACAGRMEQCTLLMSAAQQVTATFRLNPTLLLLTKEGVGSGSVTSAPLGMGCGSDCTEASYYFDKGDTVTLTATAEPGSRFVSWGGACSGAGTTCTVTLNELKSVTATFAAGGYQIYLPLIARE